MRNKKTENVNPNVCFEGYPFYIERTTTGAPLSDFGSHFGIKANLKEEKFGKLAYYTCLPGMGGMFSHSWFKIGGKNPERRGVCFHPFYIKEKAIFKKRGGAEFETFWVGTDVLLIGVKLEKREGLTLVLDSSHPSARENVNDEMVVSEFVSEKLRMEEGNVFDLHLIRVKNFRKRPLTEYGDAIEFSQDALVNFINSPLGRENSACRAFFPSFCFKVDADSKKGEISSVNPVDEAWVLVSFSDLIEDAIKNGRNVFKKLNGRKLDEIFKGVEQDWKKFLKIGDYNSKLGAYKNLYEMALTALRMNLYAPRKKMNHWCSVPCKIHFNYFWGWDTAFHSLGQNYFDPEMAKDNLRLQFMGMKKNGMLCSMLDDTINASSDISQPPAQGWAIDEIYEKTGDTKFLLEMYEKSKRYLLWFHRYRDLDEGGLYEFHCAGETGWDDTPRFLGLGKNVRFGTLITTIDSVDLNSWLCLYITNMAKWAKQLGKEEESRRWERRRKKLIEAINRYMWSEQDGCWFDIRRVEGRHELVKILSPAIWFPAWLGACDEDRKAKLVIEKHLLNPEEFFGKYPIPSIAYNSKFYDKKEEGCYWQGQIWLVLVYSAWDTLKKYGYNSKAGELRKRVLEMMYTPEKGGVYENYNALTGEIGKTGHSKKTALSQFGWSSTFVLRMLTE
jgi:hypothetical protein